MSQHITDNEYSKLFPEKVRAKALETALDTRKFEIEMYWKRAAYFWAFIAASFAGYFALLSSSHIDNYRIVTILVSLIGFCFSLGWYFVNRGSKFWQENWECHVGKLERSEQGPLFASVLIPKKEFSDLKGSYPFSVSKVNQILSMVITVVWAVMFIGSIFYSLHMTDKWHQSLESCGQGLSCCCIIMTSLIILIIIAYIIYRYSLSFAKEKICPSAKETFFLNHNTKCDDDMKPTIRMGNDEFILYIRKQHPKCKIVTNDLGKKIWEWILEKDKSATQYDEDMPCLWESNTGDKNIDKFRLPKTATQFEFRRDILPHLYEYLDELGEK